MMEDAHVRAVQLPQQRKQGGKHGHDSAGDTGVSGDAGVLHVADVDRPDTEPEVADDSPESDIDTYVRALFRNTWGHDEVPESLVVWMQAQLSLLWKGQMALDAGARAALESLKWHDTSIGALARTAELTRDVLDGEDGVRDRADRLSVTISKLAKQVKDMRRGLTFALAACVLNGACIILLALKSIYG